MKVAIYARVSTDEQNYEQQVNACIKFCEIKGWTYIIFSEKQSTRKDRPIFADVLSRCKKGEFKSIVVFRIDRAYRSSRQFIMDVDSLSAIGINIISVMEGFDPTTPIGKCMMTVFVALAELERTNISIATKQRLEALRNLGKTLGRPKGSKDNPKKPRRKSGYYRRWDKQKGGRKTNE